MVFVSLQKRKTQKTFSLRGLGGIRFPPLNPLNNHPNPLRRNGKQCLPYSAYSLALCARYKTSAHISVCAANRRYTWSERVGRATSARRTALQPPRLLLLFIGHVFTAMHKWYVKGELLNFVCKPIVFQTKKAKQKCLAFLHMCYSFSLAKYSFVAATTIPLRPMIPIKFGIAMRPFIVSEIFQMISKLPTAPKKTQAI